MPPQQSTPSAPLPPHAGMPFAAMIITIMAIFALAGLAWKMGLISATMPSVGTSPETASTRSPEDLDRIIQGLEEVAETGQTSVPIMMEQNGEVSTTVAALKEGTYVLQGQGASGGKYSGTVVIAKRQGTANVYDLQWNIGSGEVQYGVGVLQGGILSIGYYQTQDGAVIEAGAVGFLVVDESYLKGQWASARGGGVGVEDLVWRSAQ